MKRILIIIPGLGIALLCAIVFLRTLSNQRLFAQPGLFDMAAGLRLFTNRL